jgi:hypothetical protein
MAGLPEQIRAVRTRWQNIAMTTDMRPYIRYLEEKLRLIADDKRLTEQDRNEQVKLYEQWIKLYNDMR